MLIFIPTSRNNSKHVPWKIMKLVNYAPSGFFFLIMLTISDTLDVDWLLPIKYSPSTVIPLPLSASAAPKQLLGLYKSYLVLATAITVVTPKKEKHLNVIYYAQYSVAECDMLLYWKL